MARGAKITVAKPAEHVLRPSRDEVEDAVRTLIRWTGDDPDREGLLETPARVARAYEQWFAGYTEANRSDLTACR